MNKPDRKLDRTALAVLSFALGAFGTAAIAAYPDKPIKVVIGFPAGGPLDQHARLLTDKLQAVLGQPLVVDYKPGAGGSVGADAVAKSPADGYTLMLANTDVAVINGALYSKLPYDTQRDFVPPEVREVREVRERMVSQGADPAYLGS